MRERENSRVDLSAVISFLVSFNSSVIRFLALSCERCFLFCMYDLRPVTLCAVEHTERVLRFRGIRDCVSSRIRKISYNEREL